MSVQAANGDALPSTRSALLMGVTALLLGSIVLAVPAAAGQTGNDIGNDVGTMTASAPDGGEFTSGGVVWTGEALEIDPAGFDGALALRRVTSTGEVGTYVTELAPANGTELIRLQSDNYETGGYVITSDGDPVRIEDGQPVGTANVSAAAFEIVEQQFAANITETSVPPNGTATLSLSSNRESYPVRITSSKITRAELADALGDQAENVTGGGVAVTAGSDTTLSLSLSAIDVRAGEYPIVVNVPGSAATDGATLRVRNPNDDPAVSDISSGNIVWQGQTPRLDVTDVETPVRLRETTDGQLGDLVRESEPIEGSSTIEVETYSLESGTYAFTSGGDPLRIENGELHPADNVQDASFEVAEQFLVAIAQPDTVTPNGTVTVDLTSTRAQYPLDVYSETLTTDQLSAALGEQVESVGDGSVRIQGTWNGEFTLSLSAIDSEWPRHDLTVRVPETESDEVSFAVAEPPAGEPEAPDDAPERPVMLSSGGIVWAGQTVQLDTAGVETPLVLRTVENGDAQGVYAQVAPTDGGTTLQFPTDTMGGTEFVFTSDGEPIRFTDGEASVADSLDAATFEVVEQQLNAEFESENVSTDGSVTLSVDSSRVDYPVVLDSTSLSTDQLADALGDSVENTTEDGVVVTAPSSTAEFTLSLSDVDVDAGTYNVTADVPDTTASDTATIEVEEESDDDDESDFWDWWSTFFDD